MKRNIKDGIYIDGNIIVLFINGKEQELDISNPKIKKAFEFAEKAHKGAFRKGGLPYIVHPVEIAILVQKYHPKNESAIIGALLHDTIEENPEITKEIIAEEFEKEIATIVDEVTDYKTKFNHLSKSETKILRRQKQIENLDNLLFESKIIRLADKTANITDIYNINKDPKEQENYLDFVKVMYGKLKDIKSPLVEILANQIRSTKINAPEAPSDEGVKKKIITFLNLGRKKLREQYSLT